MIGQLFDLMMGEEKMKDSIFGTSLYVHRKEDSIPTTGLVIAAISVHCHVKNLSRSQTQQQKKKEEFGLATTAEEERVSDLAGSD